MSAVPDNERSERRLATPGRALVPLAPRRAAFAWPSARHAALVAAFGLALGGGIGGFHVVRHAAMAWTRPSPPDPQAALLHRLQDEVGRLQSSVDALRSVAEASRPDEPLRGLKRSVEALKQDMEQVRTSGSASVAQLAAKIDKADHDPSPKLAEIAARLDRIEHAGAAKAPDVSSQKVADLTSRVERGDKQVSAPATTGSIPASVPHAAPIQVLSGRTPTPAARPEVTQVAASENKAPPAKPSTIDGWVLRDVYDGIALVQARGGGMREVEPGEYLPGAGEIRSIERRGRTWVVLTSRGEIGGAAF